MTFALLAATLPFTPAAAQRVQRIAAIVNDDIVSIYDLEARMRIVITSTGLKPTPQLQRRLAGQILRRLIDERLQLQEAKRRNVSVSKRNLDMAIAEIERQNSIPRGGFERFIQRNGIPTEAALSQIRAQIAWNKLIGRVLSPRVSIGEDEIEEELARLKARRGQVEYHLSEILLTIDSADRRSETRRTAERLVAELRKGANFEALARQFSRGASASVGGDLGWIAESALDEEVRSVVPGMAVGAIAGPVETLSDLRILQLQRKRRVMDSPADKTIVDLRQIMLPLPAKPDPREVAAQKDLAGLIAETVSGCDDMARAAREANSSGPTALGKLKLSDLSPGIRSTIEGLPVGKPSKPVEMPSGIGVFMVCARDAPEGELPSRKEIADRMRRERLEILARRYMRDLRSAAIVDLRV